MSLAEKVKRRIFKAGTFSSRGLLKKSASGVRGFSFVELIAVIFVLTLLVAIVYPKIGVGGDLKSVSRKLIGTIQHAYSTAESEKQPYRLHYDLTYGEYWISEAATDADDDASQDAKPEKLRRLPKGIKFTKVETLHFGDVVDGRAFTHFYPIGRVEPTVIHLQNEEYETLSLSINPLTARVTVSFDAE